MYCTVFQLLDIAVIIMTSSGSGFCLFYTRRACQEPEHCTERSRKKEEKTTTTKNTALVLNLAKQTYKSFPKRLEQPG